MSEELNKSQLSWLKASAVSPPSDTHQEFDAWLSFRPEFAEVLIAFRKAFGTDTTAESPTPVQGERCPSCDGPPGPSPMAECVHPFHDTATDDHGAEGERFSEQDRNRLDNLSALIHLPGYRLTTEAGRQYHESLGRALAELDHRASEIERSWRTINDVEDALTDAGMAITHPLSDALNDLAAERDTAQAQVEELREALILSGRLLVDSLIDNAGGIAVMPGSAPNIIEAERLIRAALAQSEGSGE